MSDNTITVLFLDNFKRKHVRKLKFRPNMGDSVEWFTMPSPTINQILIPDPDGAFGFDSKFKSDELDLVCNLI